MPVIFILAYLFVAGSITMADPMAALTGIAVLAVFTLLYFVLYKMKNKISLSVKMRSIVTDNFHLITFPLPFRFDKIQSRSVRICKM